jgi:hypothetical protein
MGKMTSTITMSTCSAKTSDGTKDGTKMRHNRALERKKQSKHHVALPPSAASLRSFFFSLAKQKHSPLKKAYLHTQKFWPKAPYIVLDL